MKKTTCLCVLISLLLMSFPAAAQWIKVYNFDSGVTGKKIIQTDDGGLFTAGNYNSDIWVTKMNIEGDIEWQNSFGGDKSEGVNSIIQSSDGGYVVGGTTNSFYTSWGDKDLLLVKLSASGGIEWQQRYQVYDNATGGITSITETVDGGFVFSASISCETCLWGSSTTWHSFAIGIIKIDESGNIVWNKLFKCGKYEDFVWDLLEVEGGYLLALEALSPGIVVLKLDYDGEFLWAKSYGQGAALQIEEAANGEFIISANARSDKPIIRIDSDGNVVWAFEYTGFYYRGSYESLNPTQDGGCLIAGQGESRETAFFVKIDQDGNAVFGKEFNGSVDDRVNSVIELEDGRLAAVGQSRFFAPEDYSQSMWILTATEDGEMGECPYWVDYPVSSIALPRFAGDVDVISVESDIISAPTNFEVQETLAIANYLCGSEPMTEMNSLEVEEAKIDFKKKADDDKIHVKGNFELGSESDGVEAYEDDVIVTVGLFSEMIIFESKGKGDKWEYKRQKGSTGRIKHMKIEWKKGKKKKDNNIAKFDIHIDKADLGEMADWINPVFVSIQIGNDIGSEKIEMKEHKHHWDYKGKKHK